MTPNIEKILTETREAHAEITPTPWEYDPDYADEGWHVIKQSGRPNYCVIAECRINDDGGNGAQEIADAKGIAVSVNAITPLLALVEHLLAAVEDAPHAKGCHGNLGGHCDCGKGEILAQAERIAGGEQP